MNKINAITIFSFLVAALPLFSQASPIDLEGCRNESIKKVINSKENAAYTQTGFLRVFKMEVLTENSTGVGNAGAPRNGDACMHVQYVGNMMPDKDVIYFTSCGVKKTSSKKKVTEAKLRGSSELELSGEISDAEREMKLSEACENGKFTKAN